jgi:uncharacterized membrane protein (DUF106 family)
LAAILSLLPFSRVIVDAQKWCFWWVNLYFLPSVSMRFFLNKIVSLCALGKF